MTDFYWNEEIQECRLIPAFQEKQPKPPAKKNALQRYEISREDQNRIDMIDKMILMKIHERSDAIRTAARAIYFRDYDDEEDDDYDEDDHDVEDSVDQDADIHNKDRYYGIVRLVTRDFDKKGSRPEDVNYDEYIRKRVGYHPEDMDTFEMLAYLRKFGRTPMEPFRQFESLQAQKDFVNESIEEEEQKMIEEELKEYYSRGDESSSGEEQFADGFPDDVIQFHVDQRKSARRAAINGLVWEILEELYRNEPIETEKKKKRVTSNAKNTKDESKSKGNSPNHPTTHNHRLVIEVGSDEEDDHLFH